MPRNRQVAPSGNRPRRRSSGHPRLVRARHLEVHDRVPTLHGNLQQPATRLRTWPPFDQATTRHDAQRGTLSAVPEEGGAVVDDGRVTPRLRRSGGGQCMRALASAKRRLEGSGASFRRVRGRSISTGTGAVTATLSRGAFPPSDVRRSWLKPAPARARCPSAQVVTGADTTSHPGVGTGGCGSAGGRRRSVPSLSSWHLPSVGVRVMLLEGPWPQGDVRLSRCSSSSCSISGSDLWSVGDGARCDD